MEANNLNLNNLDSSKSGFIHFVLSNSYIIFLFSVILGVIFDIFWPTNFFKSSSFGYFGMLIIILGTIIVYWAQSTSGSTKVEIKEQKTNRNFENGPYKYTRTPTHLGLFMMSLGLAFIINSPFSVLFLIIASVISKNVFLKKQEEILEAKYGKPYSDYKKKVHSWL